MFGYSSDKKDRVGELVTKETTALAITERKAMEMVATPGPASQPSTEAAEAAEKIVALERLPCCNSVAGRGKNNRGEIGSDSPIRVLGLARAEWTVSEKKMGRRCLTQKI